MKPNKIKTNKKVSALAASLITIGALVGVTNAATMVITINTDLRSISGTGSFGMITSDSMSGFDAKIQNGQWVTGANAETYPTVGGLTTTMTGGVTPNPKMLIWDSGLFLIENRGASTGETVTFQGPFSIDLTNSVYDDFWNNIETTFGPVNIQAGTLVPGDSVQWELIPEPSSAFLIGFGALGLVARRKRTV